MKISIVVPAFNEEKYIRNCLDSLIDQNTKPDEIIVVDNNCTDKTISLVKKYKNIKIIKEKRQGIAYSRNAGFNKASGDILVKIDADAVLPKYYVNYLKSAFSKKSTIAYVGDFILRDVFIFRWSKIFSYLYQLFFKIIYGHNILIGPAFAIKKNVWLKRKNKLCMDDDQAHEDIDLSIHISTLGEIFYDRKNVVFISGRRMKFNPLSFFVEYPLIFLKMLGSHRPKLNK